MATPSLPVTSLAGAWVWESQRIRVGGPVPFRLPGYRTTSESRDLQPTERSQSPQLQPQAVPCQGLWLSCDIALHCAPFSHTCREPQDLHSRVFQIDPGGACAPLLLASLLQSRGDGRTQAGNAAPSEERGTEELFKNMRSVTKYCFL